MDFVTGLSMRTDQKDKIYDLILIIVNYFIKIVYYKLVKIIIYIFGLVKVIINTVMHYHGVLDFIVSNQQAVFISKFWFSLRFKRRLFTAFHL